MDFWGGAMPGSRKCECGILGQCDDPTKWCNCDAGELKIVLNRRILIEMKQNVLMNIFWTDHGTWTADGGDLKGKEYLPVKRLHFGDTGTPLDDKKGKYTLGALMCEGDGNLIFYFYFFEILINWLYYLIFFTNV